jgi:hypothetical protein
LIHDGATPRIEIDPETYAVTADGELLVCEPVDKLPMAQRYFFVLRGSAESREIFGHAQSLKARDGAEVFFVGRGWSVDMPNSSTRRPFAR